MSAFANGFFHPRHRFEHNGSQNSGTSYDPVSPTSPNVSPKDSRIANDFGNYRRELLGSALESSGGTLPLIQHNSPISSQIAPWMSNNGSSVTPNSAFGTSFYNDSSDNLSQASPLSPGIRPGTGRTGNTSDSPDIGYYNDERRPSVASVTTASSSGSKSSVNRAGGYMHKKLQGFFGDDFPGKEGAETVLPKHEIKKEHRAASYTRQRERNHSSKENNRDQSPAAGGSRPRTPLPSSDVVPFLYQDSQVSSIYEWPLCLKIHLVPDQVRQLQVSMLFPMGFYYQTSWTLLCSLKE